MTLIGYGFNGCISFELVIVIEKIRLTPRNRKITLVFYSFDGYHNHSISHSCEILNYNFLSILQVQLRKYFLIVFASIRSCYNIKRKNRLTVCCKIIKSVLQSGKWQLSKYWWLSNNKIR